MSHSKEKYDEGQAIRNRATSKYDFSNKIIFNLVPLKCNELAETSLRLAPFMHSTQCNAAAMASRGQLVLT